MIFKLDYLTYSKILWKLQQEVVVHVIIILGSTMLHCDPLLQVIGPWGTLRIHDFSKCACTEL